MTKAYSFLNPAVLYKGEEELLLKIMPEFMTIVLFKILLKSQQPPFVIGFTLSNLVSPYPYLKIIAVPSSWHISALWHVAKTSWYQNYQNCQFNTQKSCIPLNRRWVHRAGRELRDLLVPTSCSRQDFSRTGWGNSGCLGELNLLYKQWHATFLEATLFRRL